MSFVVSKWQMHVDTPRAVTVLPDGCRDIIIAWEPNKAASIILTNVETRFRKITLPAGTFVSGMRLAPGVAVSKCDLDAARVELPFPSRVAQWDAETHIQGLTAFVDGLSTSNKEIVEVAAACQSVADMARCLGVTERTLLRHCIARTGISASRWLQLARLRRAMTALSTNLGLAEIAAIAGYSDQAHLTRSFTHALGKPPASFRRDDHLMRLAEQPGFSG